MPNSVIARLHPLNARWKGYQNKGSIAYRLANSRVTWAADVTYRGNISGPYSIPLGTEDRLLMPPDLLHLAVDDRLANLSRIFYKTAILLNLIYAS
jgi:hypothetical protein